MQRRASESANTRSIGGFQGRAAIIGRVENETVTQGVGRGDERDGNGLVF
jgi:hypothetical protein